MDELYRGLAALVGPEAVTAGEAELAGSALDTWPLRLLQRVKGRAAPPPLLVVRPGSTGETAAVVRYLNELGLPMVPRGGGSGVTGGAEPVHGGVVVDLSRLNQILALNEEDLTVTAQAGVLLGRLETWLNQHGYIGGHYPQSIDLAQLGGLVATRSSGQFSTKYGNIEDLLMGLEAVLPTGEVVRLGPAPRRAVGPDLRHLWLGSEGALGLITEVTLKIFPRPAERWLGSYTFGSMRDGLGAVRQVMREGWRPAVVRLHDGIEAERKYGAYVQDREPILLLLAEGPEGLAHAEGAGIDRAVRAAGGRPLGSAPVEEWLAHRNDVSDFDKYINMGILVDTIEVAAPWSAIADIYEEGLRRLVEQVPELLVASAHSSHSYPQGTNLYFIVAAHPQGGPEEAERVYWAIWERLMAVTLEKGGTICHHHGIGKLRTRWVPDDLGSAYPLLRGLKQSLDPKGLCNPGTLLP